VGWLAFQGNERQQHQPFSHGVNLETILPITVQSAARVSTCNTPPPNTHTRVRTFSWHIMAYHDEAGTVKLEYDKCCCVHFLAGVLLLLCRSRKTQLLRRSTLCSRCDLWPCDPAQCATWCPAHKMATGRSARHPACASDGLDTSTDTHGEILPPPPHTHTLKLGF
jgi:hypothetical protein